MVAYVVRRIAWAAVLMLAITWVTYVLFFVIPTERSGAARRTALSTGSSDVRTAIPVHGPIYQEYGQFLWAIAHGQLGRSSTTREDVVSILRRTAPVTASLVIGGALLWLVIAIPVGILAAVHPGSLFDRGSTVFVLLGISAHPVWIGLIFSYFLGFKLHLMPMAGYCDVFNPPTGAQCGGLFQWGYHMVLPWVTFALLFAALYVRMIRATVIETLDEDHVRTARAKGSTESRVLRSHVLRTAMLPVVTMFGMDLAIALGGAVFVERVYGLPGLGSTMLAALPRSDLPTIMGVILFATFVILLLNLVIDLLYAVVDPRIRLARSSEVSD
jgi:peptide/nickel transport system permease protein